MDSDQEKTFKQKAKEASLWIVFSLLLITLLFWVYTGDFFFSAVFSMVF